VEQVRADVRRGNQKEAVGINARPNTMALALDEVFVRINGETYYFWRAVDH
jgi:transposase-like protein